MAEEFEAAGICGGNYWWNMNNNCSSSSPLCSIAANNDAGNYFSSVWQTHNLMDHHDSLGFLVHDQKQNLNQNESSSPSSVSENNRNVLMDSTLLGFVLPPSSNWSNNHSLHGRPEGNYQSVLEEEGGGDSSNSAEMRTTNQEFAAIEQQNLSYGLCVEEHNIIPLQFQPDQGSLFTNPSLVASSYNNSTNQVSPAENWSKASPDHFLKPSSMPIIKHQLGGFHFSNNASPDDRALNDVLAPHGFASSPLSQTFQHKASFPVALLTKHKREEVPVSEEAAAFKRPRIETPSPLPTFKVRKEKLGDRITALQQLVSPFGKTDTASVLHEAIEYIKYLHDQVSVLSAPYMNNNNGQHYQGCDEKESKGEMQDLRSQGLCVAPISSTFSLANYEMTMATTDFWTHAYGGALMR